jgi:hypothetical protein
VQSSANPAPPNDSQPLPPPMRSWPAGAPPGLLESPAPLGLAPAAVEPKKAGWTVNHKRIHRLWIAEGLRVPYRKKKGPLRASAG